MKLDKKKISKNLKNSQTLRIAVVVSNFNRSVTDKLLKGAKQALKENGVIEKNIKVVRAPGAFEIPIITASLIRPFSISDEVDGIITLGCVIKGETAHFDYISSSVSNTLNQLSVNSRIPIGFGILTCYTKHQALDRCKINPITSDGNKGYETAMAVLETINLIGKPINEMTF
jgi:6,7-dimethyl-8-ribityllumazine synthase